MRAKSGSGHEGIVRLAANQHGAVAAWQLLRMGLSRRQIGGLDDGWLHRVYRGVYAVGHPNLSREGELMAATLACGPAAVVSHWSAAEHWGLLRTRRSIIAISVHGHRKGHQGLRVHRLKKLDSRDRTRRDRIPITTVPRTLLDLAAAMPDKALRRAVNEAERLGVLKERAMRKTLERHRRRAGTARLGHLVAAVDPQAHRSRSDLELEFLAFCRRYGLPTPVLNGEIEGYEVDMHWPGTGLIVELDTWDYHGTSGSFESDRERDAHLAGRGYVVVRITARMMETDPDGVATTIRRLLTTM